MVLFAFLSGNHAYLLLSHFGFLVAHQYRYTHSVSIRPELMTVIINHRIKCRYTDAVVTCLRSVLLKSSRPLTALDNRQNHSQEIERLP
ncbi:hypothetical protein B0H11DRAFT_17643 [Mycena galericulata]|nr:hypothetical protein B0H11DRAFT_17643 [Mycena galericulata]